MILRVPVTVGSIAEWARRVATAVNQLAQVQDAVAAGPYVDDAAAADGGIALGALYRRADGSLAWRMS